MITAPFQWERHSDQECKVAGDYTCPHKMKCIQMCEHIHENAKGALAKGVEKQHNVRKGRLPGITPNMIIGCVNKSAPPPVISSEHHNPRPPVAKNNLFWTNLNAMELPCKAMACTQCIIHWVATTGSVHCPYCYSMHIKPASNLVLLLLKDVLVHCTMCTRDMRAGMYEHHECTPSLTHEEQRSAAKLIKRISPEKGVFRLSTGRGTFKANFQIVNVAAPNSVQNTCVLCCFAADDSFTNL